MRTQHGAFPATRWSVVVASRNSADAAANRMALDELCGIYWHPLYSYARHQGIAPADAEDLTQSFLVFVLEKDLFAQADEALGRLRNYLLTAFGRHIKHWQRQAGALKRGGGQQIVSIEASQAEDNVTIDPADHRTPEEVYQRQCALSMIETAVCHLAAEQDAAGKGGQFEMLRPRLDPTQSCSGNDAELAAALGMSHDAVRKTISRLRKRFREILHELVAATLSNPTEESIQEELASLRNALVG
ncbi:MAG TPA: RNA polymerase subunit sigma-24 [Verrucomicrobiales bacterium]|nr:RNA polymerase subunit sigma-24 [Verrucomicrobiales bacterium]HCN75770.1 RNA polymerase subunit sigma-24 [Verrucomicrobiales bacterium]HRJ10563.1 sigma-70 family RNA polymerase sigma factor [Prosthecobacter sp.]HRK16578.1 sigma-70 family RNA polymerase sigma factor [Prosthecobacter sp.]